MIKSLKRLKRQCTRRGREFFSKQARGLNHIRLSVRYRFLHFAFHFFLSQISTFVKTPSSRHFVILGHCNSDTAIFMTQASSICPLRWLFFPCNYRFDTWVIQHDIHFRSLSIAPSKRRSFTLTSGSNYELRFNWLGASTYHRRKFWWSQNDGSVNVYYHLGTFSSYFYVNTISSAYSVLSLSSIIIFVSLISLFHVDFIVDQPAATLESLVN